MSSDQFTHRLVLPSVRLSDAGEYTAVAGSSMSKAQLGVEGRDVKISEPSDKNVSVSSHIPGGWGLGWWVSCSARSPKNPSIKPHKRSDSECQT